MQDNTGKKYHMKATDSIMSKKYFDNVRRRLKLTEEQLSDSDIKKVVKLNGKLIGEWVVNNVDGFKIKNNGIIAVSKFLPKCLRGDKQEKIEEIMANPHYNDYIKEMFTKRYKKSLSYYKNFGKEGTAHMNLHSFFYIYRIMWFNSRNCAFDKAELYELTPTEAMKDALNQKIISGKDYIELLFSDFRERKRDKLTPKKLAEREERKRLKLLKQQELENEQ